MIERYYKKVILLLLREINQLRDDLQASNDRYDMAVTEYIKLAESISKEV